MSDSVKSANAAAAFELDGTSKKTHALAGRHPPLQVHERVRAAAFTIERIDSLLLLDPGLRPETVRADGERPKVWLSDRSRDPPGLPPPGLFAPAAITFLGDSALATFSESSPRRLRAPILGVPASARALGFAREFAPARASFSARCVDPRA